MRCQHCGHEVPEGSVFCNQCGYRMKTDMACPHCGASIPATSIYCPKCGNAVETQAKRPANPAASQAPATTYNQQRQAAAQRPARQPNAWQKPAAQDDDQEENGGERRSNFNRNLIIGIVAAVVLIGLLSLLRHCNSTENDNLKALGDSAAMVADDSQDPMALFQAELSRAGMIDDQATPACAVRFNNPASDSLKCIVGVTYKNDPSRPFIKIYKLTRQGGTWTPELAQTKYFDGRTISMDNNALIADQMQVPRAVTVDGKQCLYFALLDHLKGSENGRVTLCLFDVDGKRLTSLNYDGQLRSRTDGRQYVYGQPLESTNSVERRFLAQEAANIGAIHVPTQEELDAEKEAEEEEAANTEEANQTNEEKWSKDNAENMDKLKNGEEVKMRPTMSDKPTINFKDIKTKAENDNYIVFLDNKGSVQGFNKNTRKYFGIYSDSKNPAKSISMNGGKVNIQTGSGTISYDLASDRAKVN